MGAGAGGASGAGGSGVSGAGASGAGASGAGGTGGSSARATPNQPTSTKINATMRPNISRIILSEQSAGKRVLRDRWTCGRDQVLAQLQSRRVVGIPVARDREHRLAIAELPALLPARAPCDVGY